MDEQRQEDQLDSIYNSPVPIRDVALKTCWERWTIEKGGGRGSGRSVQVAQQDDDDEYNRNIVLDRNTSQYTTVKNVLKQLHKKCHHHHIALVARISLTLSRHSSLSFIALGRSSGQHPVSSHNC